MSKILAAVIHAARWPILGIALAITLTSAVWGPGVFGEVQTAGSFVVADSESNRTAEQLAERFPETDHDVIAVVSLADGASADDPAAYDTVAAWVDTLPSEDIASVTTPWGPPGSEIPPGPDPRFVSSDGTQVVVAMTMSAEVAQQRNDDFVAIAESSPATQGLSVQYAGPVPTEAAVGQQTKADVTNAETWSMPILSVLLIIVFGSLVSSLLPVLVAGAATLGSFAALRLIAGVTEVSIFAVTIASILALVLAVDYGLIIVSRYREEMARGRRGREALEHTLSTAGETVAASGLLVAISLSVLLLFPQNFLKSMAYGGIATLFVALTFALVVLPACLAILGPRIDALRVPWRLRHSTSSANHEAEREGLLSRVARIVMRRPAITAAIVLLALAPLVTPAFGLQLGSVDHRVLPSTAEVHQAAEDLADGFPGVDAQPVTILVDGVAAPPEQLLADIAEIPGVSGVDLLGLDSEGAYLQAHLETDWQGTAAEQVVTDLRSLDAPDGTGLQVGGLTAEMVDQLDAIYQRAPMALGLLALAVFIVLFVAFGSVLLPIQAIVLNMLSVGAAFGVMVFVFQDGHLEGLLGFTATGTLDPSNLILVFCLLFGLSMDYEVFMLARIKEEYDRTGNNEQAVSTGLQATAGIITAAAALLLVVVGAFSFAGISFIKMIGIGMVVAITIDVLLIRTLLVPASMRLLGDLNWWPDNRARRRGTSGPPDREDDTPVITDADTADGEAAAPAGLSRR